MDRYIVCEVGREKRQFTFEVEPGEKLRVCLMDAFRQHVGHDGSLYAPCSPDGASFMYVGTELRLQSEFDKDTYWIIGKL